MLVKMEECLQCGKELTHTPGRKKKKFCDAKCKQEYFSDHSPVKKLLEYCKEKGITVDELIEHHKKISASDWGLLIGESDKQISSVELTGVSVTKNGQGAEFKNPVFAKDKNVKISLAPAKKLLEEINAYEYTKTDKHLPGLTAGFKQVKEEPKEVEITYGGRGGGKMQNYLEKRRKQKLG